MSVAAVLAIVVAVGEAQSSTSVALMAAAEESVGTATTVRMVEVPAPSRAAGLSVERQLGAGSVVVLSWKEPAHLHAVLLHHVVATDRWTIRRMSFARADALHERGRTLGLAVASMSPEIWRPVTPPSAAPVVVRGVQAPRPPPPATTPAPTTLGARLTSPAESKRVPAPAVVAPVASAQVPEEVPREVPQEVPRDPGRVELEAPGIRAAAAPPVARRAPVRPPAAPPAPRSRTFAMGLAAVGSSGLGGPADGRGGMLEGVWYVRRRLALRVGLGLRLGDVPELPDGRDLTATAAVGLEWWVLGGARDEGWGLGMRLDALALHHRLTASSSATASAGASASEAQSETRPGADALVAAYLGLGRNLDLVAATGLEVVDGSTDIRLHVPDSRVATIPAYRAVGFAGLRVAW
jgi:hypothetical protein